jgi:hypothetical protein
VNGANNELLTKGAHAMGPLHIAAERGQLLSVQYLLKFGANVNAYSKHGEEATDAQGRRSFGLIGEVRTCCLGALRNIQHGLGNTRHGLGIIRHGLGNIGHSVGNIQQSTWFDFLGF